MKKKQSLSRPVSISPASLRGYVWLNISEVFLIEHNPAKVCEKFAGHKSNCIPFIVNYIT